MKEKLIDLIKEYLVDANIAYDKYCKVISNSLGVYSREELYEQEGLSLVTPHGSGILIKFGGIIVDFDFDMSGGPKRKIRGVDAWFLSRYARDNKKEKYAFFYDYDSLNKVIEELILHNIISPKGSLPVTGSLYYFMEDYEYLAKEKPWEEFLKNDNNL